MIDVGQQRPERRKPEGDRIKQWQPEMRGDQGPGRDADHDMRACHHDLHPLPLSIAPYRGARPSASGIPAGGAIFIATRAHSEQ